MYEATTRQSGITAMLLVLGTVLGAASAVAQPDEMTAPQTCSPTSSQVAAGPHPVGVPNFGYDALPIGTPGRSSYRSYLERRREAGGTESEPIPHAAAAGGMFVGDAFIDIDGERWVSVLVAESSAGGRLVYAVDVSDPGSAGPANLLWEFTDPDLGVSIGQPQVARMADGTWVAVFANGTGSDGHRAVLFIVRLEDGSLLKKIDTRAGSVTRPNGLAAPALLADRSRVIQAIYAGDALGNLWEFDVSSSSVSDWVPAYRAGPDPAPLFTAEDSAGNAQPITSAPDIGAHPQGGLMLYFGTEGRTGTGESVETSGVQSFYGIWRKPDLTSTAGPGRKATLQEQEILWQGTPPGIDFAVRVTSDHPVDWSRKNGWYLDLASPDRSDRSEQLLSSPVLRDGRVIFSTGIRASSDDGCKVDRARWLMAVGAVDGERRAPSPVDINNDDRVDAADLIPFVIDGEPLLVPVSAVRLREAPAGTPMLVPAPRLDRVLVSAEPEAIETLRLWTETARVSWRELQ